MAKNIVLCLDGTADFAARNPTHVFRLFRGLERSPAQVIYYDGGVGTLRDAGELSPIKKRISQVLDLAAGFSIREHLLEAYEFLCKTYEVGDQIYVFGFSRGAYTARVLAGAIDKFGVPYQEHLNILPYLWQSLSEVNDLGEETSRFFNRLKRAFGRPADIAFLGLWDTVSAFGLGKLRTIPQTAKLQAAKVVRHAVSIDEPRSMFPENLVSSKHPDLQEVWFAGVHRDVGGGGNTNTLGLSMIPFNWILGEAEAHGLKIEESSRQWMTQIAEDPCLPDNYSRNLVIAYAFASLVPMRVWSTDEGRFIWQWLKFWRVRPIPNGAKVHRSVQDRMQCLKQYKPKNVHNITWFP